MTAPAAFDMVRALQHGEETLRQAARILLASGLGCDMDGDEHGNLDDDPNDFDTKINRHVEDNRMLLVVAAMLWGLRIPI